jgi:hypothetical protein
MLKRILKILAGVIIVLAVALYFSYDYWLEKELRYQLSEIINKDPNSLYEYSFSTLDINLINGSVDLKGIVIEPTKTAFDSLNSMTNGLRFLVHLSMEEIELSGFEITEFLTTGIISMKSLTISEPSFDYHFMPHKKQLEQAMVLNNVFSKKFKEANLDKFLIDNARIQIIDATKSGPAILIHDIRVKMTMAHIDSATLKRFSPFDYEDIKVKAAGINVEISKDFSINSDSLIFYVEEETFAIKNFQLKPKYSQQNFAKTYSVQKQWFAITLDSLIINDINFDEFVETGHVDIGRLDVIKPNIGLYKDKSKPPPPFKKKLLPASAINSIPWRLTVDSIMIENGFITINETSSETGNDSNLTFNKLNGQLLNFTNDSLKLSQSPLMKLSASTLVFDKALTTVSLEFDLTSKIDEFKASGTMGKVEAITFNPVLEPMMAVKVTNGTINSLEFDFLAMDTLSVGTLDADYAGIKLEILNKDTTANQKSKKGFMTFAANTAIKSNNSKDQGGYLQGIINTPRVQEKDVWPYLWHSIQAGLVSTLAPFTNTKEAKQQQKIVKQELRKEKKEGTN